MSDLNNNMDRIFREKLGDYSKNPPDDAWAFIRAETDKRRARKLIMVAWRVAAGIAIIITAGYSYYYFTRTGEQTLTETLKTQQETVTKPETIEKGIPDTRSEKIEEITETDKKIPLKGKQDDATISEPETIQKLSAGITREKVTEDKMKTEAKAKVETDYQVEAILMVAVRDIDLSGIPYFSEYFKFRHDRIPEKKNVDPNLRQYLYPSLDLSNERTDRKDIWSVTAQVSPTYNYRNLSHGDQNYIASMNEIESGKVSYAGGLQMGLKATERLSLFAGLMYSKMGFEIKNVLNYQADIRESLEELTFQQPSNTTNLYSVSNSTGFISSVRSQNKQFFGTGYANQYFSQDKSPASNIPGILTGSDKIDQFFQFIELPFMLRYNLLNRKLRMNLLGGLSTNVLVGNRVVLVTGKDRSTIGETQGIRTINYSGNLGFGFDYDLGKNFLFTIEPQFKYYLNNINDNISLSSRPYSIGMFTGIKYIF